MPKNVKITTVALALLLTLTGTIQATTCGVANRRNCEADECKGREVKGCTSCGFLCEKCDCGEPTRASAMSPVEAQMVCCNVSSFDCGGASSFEKLEWTTMGNCRALAGVGQPPPTCPASFCGK